MHWSNNQIRKQFRLATMLLIVASLAISGCKAPWSKDWKPRDMFDLNKGMPWSHDGPEEGIPDRIVGTWTDTVLNQPGKTPQRGFGGRLIFYGKDSEKPILVDGQLVVYAFDETNREVTDNKPTRRYVFPADQVARHMSKTDTNASYSFWLPWDEAGGPQTEISLISRFEPKGGAVVVGEQTKHLLPGALTDSQTQLANTPPKLPPGIPSRPAKPQISSIASAANAAGGARVGNGIQQTGYENTTMSAVDPNVQPADGNIPPELAGERRMTTTSISLPENFRLRGGATPAVSAADARAMRIAAAPIQPAMPVRQANGNALFQPPATPSVQPTSLQAAPMQNAMNTGVVTPMNGFVPQGGVPMVPQPSAMQLPSVPSPGQQSLAAQQTNMQTPNVQTNEAGVTTTVTYGPVAGPAAAGASAWNQQPSYGYQSQRPLAPGTPVVR